MSATVLYMSISLDGFIAGPNEGPDNGLGDGGHRLHEWFFARPDPDDKGVSGRPADALGAIPTPMEKTADTRSTSTIFFTISLLS